MLAVALLVVLVWSACFVVIKASLGDAPPLLYAALRALLSGLPLLGLATLAGKLRPPAALWPWLALLGITNTTLGLAAMFLSVGLAGVAIQHRGRPARHACRRDVSPHPSSSTRSPHDR